MERDPDTIIITVDDDVYYHPNVVGDLVTSLVAQGGKHPVVRSCEVTEEKAAGKYATQWKLDVGVCKVGWVGGTGRMWRAVECRRGSERGAAGRRRSSAASLWPRPHCPRHQSAAPAFPRASSPPTREPRTCAPCGPTRTCLTSGWRRRAAGGLHSCRLPPGGQAGRQAEAPARCCCMESCTGSIAEMPACLACLLARLCPTMLAACLPLQVPRRRVVLGHAVPARHPALCGGLERAQLASAPALVALAAGLMWLDVA